MKIGTGGEANWESHLRSKAHKATSVGEKPVKKINSFFTKLNPLSKQTPLNAGPSRLPSSIRVTPRHQPASNSPPAPPDHPPTLVASPTSDNLIIQVEKLVGRLLPRNSQVNSLSVFAGDPTLESTEYDEPLQYVNKTLHAGLGWGSSVEDVRLLVENNLEGVFTLCGWIRRCISELQVDEVLFEARLERVKEALLTLYVYHCSVSTN